MLLVKAKRRFFTDIRMRRLRKISAGGTYTIIYLKLLLLSLKDEDKPYFEKVAETEDDIMITLQYLERVGLIEVIELKMSIFLQNYMH
jgi:hypothetical protein